jgi:hypothetical protein
MILCKHFNENLKQASLYTDRTKELGETAKCSEKCSKNDCGDLDTVMLPYNCST